MTTPIRAFLVYTAAYVGFAVGREDRRIVAYLAVVGAIGAFAAFAHRRHPLQTAHAWGLALCGAMHLAGGLLPGDPVLYETWIVDGVLKYDQFVHFSVTAIITGILIDRTDGRVAKAVVLALAAGVGNEVFEHLSALRYADARVGGLSNASWDLVFNLFGALSAVAFRGRPQVAANATAYE